MGTKFWVMRIQAAIQWSDLPVEEEVLRRGHRASGGRGIGIAIAIAIATSIRGSGAEIEFIRTIKKKMIVIMVLVLVLAMATIVVVSGCRAGRSCSKRSGEESFMVVGYGAFIHCVQRQYRKRIGMT